MVNYAVTVRLTDADLSGIRAGMTAVATLQSEASADRWLVPTVAIAAGDGSAQVTVIRNGQALALAVTTGETQGEWTVVTSAALQAGDQVVGSTASFLGDGLPEGFDGPPGPFQQGG